MYRFNLPAQWQKPLRSVMYVFLILSMLWVPGLTDVSTSTASAEGRDSSFICQEGRRVITCTNLSTGVQVIVPKQRGVSDLDVMAVSIEDEPIPNHLDDEFTAYRGVVGLSIVDGKTDEALAEFKPTLKIEVAYTRSDVREAGGRKNLTLGYFDGQKMREFPDVKIEGSRRGGIISAEVRTLESYAPIKCPPPMYPVIIDIDPRTGRPIWGCKDRGETSIMMGYRPGRP